MTATSSWVTVHMAASLDGFIARKDGDTAWLETKDNFDEGYTPSSDEVVEFLKTIDCYVMGSRTYETALKFEDGGFGWAYGDTPLLVLTRRNLPTRRKTVEFVAGDLGELLNERLRPSCRSIWVVGGGVVAGECLRRNLVDEVRYSIMPVLLGEGIRFFEGLDHIVELHLVEAKSYKSGMVALRHEVRR